MPSRGLAVLEEYSIPAVVVVCMYVSITRVSIRRRRVSCSKTTKNIHLNIEGI
jgi:hypothetical protein